MTKLLSNPFFVYIISFSLVLLVYSLGWSAMYPDLAMPLIVFFFVTFLISFFCGVATHTLKRIEYREITWDEKTRLYLLFAWLGYFLEFRYNNGVPLQLLMQGAQYDYTLFGIPVFHVFLVTFSSFLSVYIFHQLLSGFSRQRLMYFVLSIIPAVLIVSRGMIIIILTSCLFVYLLSLKRIGLRIVVSMLFLVLVVLYLFGIMGNLRQTQGKTTSSDVMLETSQATQSFRNSIIPKEYIWSYLYISSPVANLQNTIRNAPESEYAIGAFLTFEILPDFISKRVAKFLNIDRKTTILIVPWLTVGTLYSNSFMYMGWPGMILLFCFFVVTTLSYILIMKKTSKYYVTGLSILCALVLFNTYDNMYYFSGLNLQLIYPILFSMMSSLNIKIKLRGA